MENVKEEYLRRVEEINRYFKFLEQANAEMIYVHLPKGVERTETLLFSTLKASAILLLYNMLESVVIQAIDYINIHISTEDDLFYKDAIDEIKKIWIEYKYNNFKGTDIGSEQILKDLQSIDNEKINIFDINKDKMVYLTKIKGVDFSGKIDAKQIRQFAVKYGFSPNRRIAGKRLPEIKAQRNQLAHGERSFNECGNNYEFQKLNTLRKEAVLYLREFLNHVEIFLNAQKYRI